MQKKKIFYDLLYPWFVDQNPEDEEGISDQNQCRISDLLGKQIRACCHGWVILSNHPNNVMWFLWNPLTSKIIRLPPLIKEQVDFEEYCLSSPPDDPSSVFLLTTYEKPTITFCRLDNKRNKLRWSKMSYTKQIRSIIGKDGLLYCPTCYNGKVYALHTGDDSDDFVIHVDIVVKEKEVVISLFPFIKLPKPFLNRFSSFIPLDCIQGSCTDLFYFKICFNDVRETSEVILFKLHVTSMTWEEMEDIKNATFFVNVVDDYESVIHMSQDPSKLGGYIHILDKFEEGKKVYSYHVKERTMSLSSIPSFIRSRQASSFYFCTKMSFYNHFLCRFEGDHAGAKCMVHSKQEEEDKDDKIVVRSIKDDKVEFFNGKMDESRLLNLPFDVLETIMEHCVGVEYMNLRATCKRCHLAAPLIPRSNKATLKRLQTYSLVSAWLMVLDKHRGIITFKDPLSGDKYFIKTPQELIDFKIYSSSYGWLLMFNVVGSMLFYNPFTSAIHKLPSAPRLESCCFSSPPTSPDCMVAGFISSPLWKIYIHFVGREQFSNTFHLDFNGNEIYSLCNPIFYGGDLYALCNEGDIYVFKDVGKEDYFRGRLIVHKPYSYSRSILQYFHVKHGEEHLVVTVGRFGESLEVLTLDDSASRWKFSFDLGKHVMYICDTTCLYFEAKTPETGNKIYFPRIHNGKIVCYSLGRRKTSMFRTFNRQNVKESIMDISGTTQHCYPHAWIEPSFS